MNIYEKKIISNDILKSEDFRIKLDTLTVSFTNGCFDILHPGHIDYLEKARLLGDLLVVGVNDDDSVSRLKGKNRPINTLKDRLVMLAALESVDYVIAFSEDTPEKLIQLVKPNILIKGADYKISEIAGAPFVQSYGGDVQLIPLKEGYSSTKFIQKIKS